MLNKFYETYRDRASFYVVYIQEAHPTDLWTQEANVRDGVLFASPRSNEERSETASTCVRRLGIHIPAILDGIDNKTERAYTSWPDRLYVVGKNGRIAYKSAPGPFGFSARNLAAALQRALQ